MNQINFLKIKSNFAEEVFRNPHVLQLHEFAKEAIIIYDTCLTCFQQCSKVQVTDCCLELGQSKSEQSIKLCYTFENTKELVVYLTPLRNESALTLSCVKKFTKDEICSIKIKQHRTNESLDNFLHRVYTQICNELVPQLVSCGIGRETESMGGGYKSQQWGGSSRENYTGQYPESYGMRANAPTQYGANTGEKFYGSQTAYQDPYMKRSAGVIGQRML